MKAGIRTCSCLKFSFALKHRKVFLGGQISMINQLIQFMLNKISTKLYPNSCKGLSKNVFLGSQRPVVNLLIHLMFHTMLNNGKNPV
ncbi:hypothetical protein DAPPUDRAFT_261494 [Daphnia pulex]|uniref:Uncharacterized protein n=1 Tax=Daphnia pulex TaxID=6669 RepID=E9HL43_DAPPU|nr:hypothetical protein DAPPUDRAFT_261494 [Daphnia pulex]|eukprot:EFX67540.1 hypothetical protein DAPPUDRAFT_261494 [Daphnia pulex]